MGVNRSVISAEWKARQFLQMAWPLRHPAYKIGQIKTKAWYRQFIRDCVKEIRLARSRS